MASYQVASPIVRICIFKIARAAQDSSLAIVKVTQALKGKLSSKEPSDWQLRRASVAVVLREHGVPSVLLIRRANRADDPWSGQVAFPGGKVREGDKTLSETAIRETREEVGVDLSKHGDFLGYFTPFLTHTGSMEVYPAVFVLKEDTTVRRNGEVASYRWVPLDKLTAEQSRSTYGVDMGGQFREVPALCVNGYVVWGLTYRIVTELFG